MIKLHYIFFALILSVSPLAYADEIGEEPNNHIGQEATHSVLPSAITDPAISGAIEAVQRYSLNEEGETPYRAKKGDSGKKSSGDSATSEK